MTQQEIKENNILLAEFMGYIDNGCSEEGFLIDPNTNYDVEIISLKFHRDWNWLMQVVDKIEQTERGTIEIQSKNLVLVSFNHETLKFYSSSLIINTYEACTAFVKWYNRNTSEYNSN